MEKPNESAHNTDIPSVDEAISWLTEYGLHTGHIPYSDSYDFHGPEEVFKRWSIDQPDESPQEDPCSAIGLKRTLNQSYDHEELLKKRVKIISKDNRLQKQTESELRRRLLNAGDTNKEIDDGTGGSGKKLSTRVISLAKMLHLVQNPTRATTNAVECRVSTGLPGTIKDASIRLPMNSSLETICDMLKAFVSGQLLSASEPAVPRQKWKGDTTDFQAINKIAVGERCGLPQYD